MSIQPTQPLATGTAAEGELSIDELEKVAGGVNGASINNNLQRIECESVVGEVEIRRQGLSPEDEVEHQSMLP